MQHVAGYGKNILLIIDCGADMDKIIKELMKYETEELTRTELMELVEVLITSVALLDEVIQGMGTEGIKNHKTAMDNIAEFIFNKVNK